MQRIRDTKFKEKCAIKLITIACEKAKCKPDLDDPDYSVILKTLKKATAWGMIEILSIYMKKFPLPLHSKSHIQLLRKAIQYRQDEVFNFLLHKHPMCRVNYYTENTRENSLHMVAKLTYCPKVTSIAGEAFQMQKELQWFKVCLSTLLTI